MVSCNNCYASFREQRAQAPVHYIWRKAYLVKPRDMIKSYRFTHCPCACANSIAKNAKANAKDCEEAKMPKQKTNKSKAKNFKMKQFKDVASRTSHKRSGAGSGGSTGDSCSGASDNTGSEKQNIDGPVKGGLAGFGMDWFASENETHANCSDDTTPESYGKERCAQMMAKQKKEYANLMKQCESAEKEDNKKDVKKERFIMKKFKDAKPKVDCKRKDTSKTGDDNELQNCCDYTPMCSGCFETCCYPGFY